MRLTDARWPELGPGAVPVDVVLVPTGSCEQHGPHLPFHTDAAVAEEVAARAVDTLRALGVNAVLAPTLPYGASGEHEHFPGTIDIGHAALHGVLVELGRSISRWSARMVLVNGHGGNAPTVSAAVTQLSREGRDVGWVACEVVWGDAHAGRTETSLMLAVEPAAVRPGLAQPGPTAPIADLMPLLRAGGVRAVSPNGVLGDPAGASAEEGEAILADLVDGVVDAVRVGRPDHAGRLRVRTSA